MQPAPSDKGKTAEAVREHQQRMRAHASSRKQGHEGGEEAKDEQHGEPVAQQLCGLSVQARAGNSAGAP